jgi:hypothetical protein
MDSSKVGHWLQVSANVGIIAGLLLVGVQINENTRIARTDLTVRSFERSMQMNLTLMGEQPMFSLQKAATDPASLTDEELGIVEAWTWYWWDHDSQLQLLRGQGLTVQDRDWDAYFKNRAKWVYGSNRVSMQVWEDMMSDDVGHEWESIVNTEIQKINQPLHLQEIKRLRAAAKGE